MKLWMNETNTKEVNDDMKKTMRGNKQIKESDKNRMKEIMV
jgi:hypothetical protein